MKKKLAIIGASIGQLPICKKAQEMHLETFCFAWDKGAICKPFVDHFYPISILEKDKIADICRENHISGVVSNASDLTAEVVAYIAEANKLNTTPYKKLISLRDKNLVRNLCRNIEGLSTPRYYKYTGKDLGIYPCVVKPCVGSAKQGVSYVEDKEELAQAIDYACSSDKDSIEIEEYIKGKEVSVESISYHGKHTVIQITDKDNTGAPHFAELGHHQPAQIPNDVHKSILAIIPKILTAIGYTDGASHVEMKYNENGIYLIEANLRGGGDEISNRLTTMSTGIDYLRCMIDVALDNFKGLIRIGEKSYAGIYYLCKQTANLLPAFINAKGQPWCVEERVDSTDLVESSSNYERNGYLIYKSDHKINLQ